MSLDISLVEENIITGKTVVFSSNISHNLGGMATAVGLGFYHAIWYPEENGINKAWDMVLPLTEGLADMVKRPDYYRGFNAESGWGTYEQFLPWLCDYLQACIKYPDTIIEVFR